jgi:hypothetical protein
MQRKRAFGVEIEAMNNIFEGRFLRELDLTEYDINSDCYRAVHVLAVA